MSTHSFAQNSSTPGDFASQRAVVIGGSMAGLFAARVLADVFGQVTVVERDDLPDSPQARKGAPQARHVHVLLLRGVEFLRARFPGLEEELLARGAPAICWSQDSATLIGGGWLPRFESDLNGYGVSRDLLEWLVRQQLLARGNIEFRTDTAVTGLAASPDNSRVTGVDVRQPDGSRATVAAHLVVDASGRSSRLPEWLAALGYDRPEESTVNADLAYATRWYRIPDGWQADWKLVLLAARYPDIPGGAVILPVEGRRWIVTLVGHRGDHPPLDEEGFLAFARGLAGPQVYDAIRQAEPISGISGYRRTENRWRHYARLARWPDGLIALGDAVCAFNPVYGQGMTVGALAAETLADVLAGPGEAGLGLAFQKRLAKMLQVPWQLATGDDFRWAGGAAGKSTLRDRLMHAYLEQVLARLHQPDVAHTFFSVTHLIQSPAALFRPGIAVPVLWRMLRGVPARQNAPAGAEPSAA